MCERCLNDLEDAGEDVDRIYEWGRALNSDMWAAMQSSKDAHLLRFGIIRLVGGDLMNSLSLIRSGADVRDRAVCLLERTVSKLPLPETACVKA